MSGASVSCYSVAQYYNSQCDEGDWAEIRAATSGALNHAMETGHNVEIHYVTVSRAEGISKEQEHATYVTQPAGHDSDSDQPTREAP